MTTESVERDGGEREHGFVESVRTAVQGLRESARVENVYGDPIEIDGKTIIPVARIVYGFGGGFGNGPESDEDAGQGGGVGGGMATQPIGVLEVTAHETRFVRFTNWKRLAAAVGIGLGRLLGPR